MMQATERILFAVLLGSQIVLAQSTRDQGIAEFNAGHYSAALADLSKAARNKSDATAVTFFALTQAAMGDCGSALSTLIREAKAGSPPLDRLAGLAAAKCYSVDGRTADAAALLAEMKNRFPTDPDVLYLDAKNSMKAFNDTMLAMFQRTPSSYRVHELSAEIFEVQSRYTDAVAEYRKAIELNPNAPDLHFRLGRALLLENHSPAALEQASAEFTAELRLNPEDSACEFQLGQIASVQGKAADAQLHFERAVAFAPRFTAGLVALGKGYMQEKQYDRAIPVLLRAIEIQPDNEAAHYALLSAYRNAGLPEKAQAEKATLDRLQKPPEGEFSEFLKKLGSKPPE